MNRFDKSMCCYQIALESVNEICLEQPATDRLKFRSIAMEAITGPDAGMVMDNLYKNVMARANVNFGKIPDSMGDLTRFARYKTIADSISLLERQMGELKVPELMMTRELHDNLIRLTQDFTYGYKVDSQFLKTTYCTMVYALCEMVNLSSVIYIDMLKCDAEGRQYVPESYKTLLLVQNVEHFNQMVKRGEWATMVTTIKRDAKGLLGVFQDVTAPNPGKPDKNYGSPMGSILGVLGRGSGVAGVATAAMYPFAKKVADQRTPAGDKVIVNIDDYINVGKTAADKAVNMVKSAWKTIPGKIAIVMVAIIGVLILIRHLICMFYKGMYKVNDILDDAEKMLRVHMDKNLADPSGTSKAFERQKNLYDALSGLHDNIKTKILKSDAEGRKEIKNSNRMEISTATFTESASDDDVDIM